MTTSGDTVAAACDACEVERIKSCGALALGDADHAHALALEQAKADIASTAADFADLLAAGEADAAHDLALRTLYHTKISEVAVASVDRARDSAKFVQTAAAALATTYAALLGLVYSVTSRTLPIRGVYAAVFLGFAVAFAVGYLAYLRRGTQDTSAYDPGATFAETQLARTKNLIEWIDVLTERRGWMMRASVCCLAVGVAFIPAAFIGPATSSAAASSVSAPAIPSAIPPAIATPATKLFQYQVDAYLASKSASNSTPKPVHTCQGVLSTFRGCGWATQTAIEGQFWRLALLGAVLVVVGAAWPKLQGES